jgi:ethanolamine utilization protein EutQ (cupin superfamily)
VEVADGVFVSNVMTDDWNADPEVGGAMHVLVARSDGYAGMSRFVDRDPDPWIVQVREVILVLEGAATIEIEGGPTLELGVGDMASLPAGARTRWRLTRPYKELWVFPRAYELADASA